MFSPDPHKQPTPEYVAKCGNEFCNYTVQIKASRPGEAENILTEHYWYPIPAADQQGHPIDIWICPRCAPIWRARIHELKSLIKEQTKDLGNPPFPNEDQK